MQLGPSNTASLNPKPLLIVFQAPCMCSIDAAYTALKNLKNRAASVSRRPAAASGPLLLPAVGEGAGGGHIRRVPSPGDGAPGSPRIAALALRASGHTPQSPASWPSLGPKERGREGYRLTLVLVLLPPSKMAAPAPAMKKLSGGPSKRALRSVLLLPT